MLDGTFLTIFKETAIPVVSAGCGRRRGPLKEVQRAGTIRTTGGNVAAQLLLPAHRLAVTVGQDSCLSVWSMVGMLGIHL